MELPPWELEEQQKWGKQSDGTAPGNKAADASVQEDLPPLTMVSTDTLTARRITYLGLVQGSVVLSKSLINHILAGTDGSLGGETEAYASLMKDSRKIAADRMMTEARGMNANGIVGVRFGASEIIQGAIEIIVYGTAVTFI